MCHVSCVMCHVSYVTCHVSHITCHMSHVTIFFFLFFSDKVVKLIGGGSVINGAYPVLFRSILQLNRLHQKVASICRTLYVQIIFQQPVLISQSKHLQYLCVVRLVTQQLPANYVVFSEAYMCRGKRVKKIFYKMVELVNGGSVINGDQRKNWCREVVCVGMSLH